MALRDPGWPLPLICLAALAGLPACAAPRVAIADNGVISELSFGEGPRVEAVRLLIPSPDWTARLFDQGQWRPDTVERAPDGRIRRLAGEATWDGGGMTLEQTISVEDDRVTVAYVMAVRGTATTAGARVMVDVPTAGLAGNGAWLRRAGRLLLARPLPAELPTPYHLGGGSAEWTAWQAGDHLTVTRVEGGTAQVSIQDNRQFRAEVFEAQWVVPDSHTLRDGQNLALTLVFEPARLSELTAAGARRVEAQSMWDTAKVETAGRGAAGIGEVQWSTQEGPRWQPVELRFRLSGTWDNPFDPAQVDVGATIEQPDGRTLRQPAFCYQEYVPLSEDLSAVVAPEGELEWRVRWTPMAEGLYRVRLGGTVSGRTVAADAGEFVCRGAAGRGFVRRSPDTPYYLRFDDGSPYFAIGENICWDGDNLIDTYRRWFERLGAAGGNYARIWLVRWNMALEWTAADSSRRGWYEGLGRYSLDNAWRLDQVMRAAAEHGIYVMLCLGYHGELQDQPDYFHAQCWATNPYNAANGGPCGKPADFWTDPAARRLYQQRLRYYLARWGADPHVLSFEFWNEVNAPAPWIEEMSRYLGENDIHGHLRTTTYGGDDTWNLPGMDYSQQHHYGSDENLVDSAPVIADTSLQWTERYRKPFMMGEFGIDWKRSDADHDPKGIGTNFHNGLWAAVGGRSFGTAALWYWDNYVDRLDLYGQFRAVANFAAMLDWSRFDARPADLEPLAYVTPPPPHFEDLTAALESHWARQPDAEIRLTHGGQWQGGRPVQFLFSPGKPDVCSPLRLRFDMPAAGAVILRVGQVSANARLVAKVDGKEALVREFPCGPPGEGRYKSTSWAEQWQIWQSVFDEDVSLPLTAGEHSVELALTAGDWLTIPTITVTGYRDAGLPNVDAWLLCDGSRVVGWIHDRASTWQADRDGREPAVIAPLRLSLGGLAGGQYRLLWYDTWAGRVSGERPLEVAADQRAVLETPTFRRDIAVMILPR